MSIIYVLIPIAMLFVLIAVGVFFWAVKSDQFDDLERHSVSILFDEEPMDSKTQQEQSQTAETEVPQAPQDRGNGI
ncbi:cbb3-type cytochrome oxidase assembly protein CcoS [Shewanella indica]|uniref:cbb3-type cytochrome oxidase assembly protein CcoS n=1 Tax=Shewanella indica TaxID=768528 RepID=UPI003D35C8D3